MGRRRREHERPTVLGRSVILAWGAIVGLVIYGLFFMPTEKTPR